MLTIFLCDDSTEVLKAYKDKLTIIKNKYKIPMVIHTFSSGKEMFFHMDDKKLTPDIIYLDIIMNDENGITVAKELRMHECRAQIVFLTANPEYVFDSFETMPTNYIIKESTSDARFEEIFLKAAIIAEKASKEILVCNNNKEQKHIPLTDIRYFEVVNRVTTIYFGKETFSYYAKLEDIEQKLINRTFIRVHRSFLVNLLYIEELHKDTIVLSSKETIPLGGTYSKKVKSTLNQYFNYIM